MSEHDIEAATTCTSFPQIYTTNMSDKKNYMMRFYPSENPRCIGSTDLDQFTLLNKLADLKDIQKYEYC